MANYHFISQWEVNGSKEEVYSILEDVERLVEWWSSVYLRVEVIKKGDHQGIGKEVKLLTKGYLPYTLQWSFRVTEVEFPNGFSLEAFGDFVGTGQWHFETISEEKTRVVFDWNIKATKPLLTYFTPVLRPLFSANHRWAMAQGEKGLKDELLRRRIVNAAHQFKNKNLV